MYPRLFTIGPIPVYSFGLMMGIGFFVASILLHKETIRKSIVMDFSRELLLFFRFAYVSIAGVFLVSFLAQHGISGIEAAFDANALRTIAIIAGIILAGYAFFGKKAPSFVSADTSAFIVIVSIIAGVSGSKLLYVIENLPSLSVAPMEVIFSPGGLTWYGGFVLTTVTLYFFIKRKGIPFLQICDATSPALMLGYGIARLGCHLAGDGDYGMPTDLPWGTVYANGTYPPSLAFRDFPEIVQKYGVNGVVPDTIPVHPAPVYEFLAAVILFLILWNYRTRAKRNGELFMLYLMFAGFARLMVEFIRLNPRLILGLSEAQLFSIILILAGALGFSLLRKRGMITPPPRV